MLLFFFSLALIFCLFYLFAVVAASTYDPLKKLASSLQLPATLKIRGRPKGTSTKTVIGTERDSHKHKFLKKGMLEVFVFFMKIFRLNSLK